MVMPSPPIVHNLECLIRTALSHGELSPGAAAKVDSYRKRAHLTPEERRYLAILEDAIADGCIQRVGSRSFTRIGPGNSQIAPA